MTVELIPVTIVGCGVIGRNHAAAVLRHARLRVAAVVDPVAEARDGLAEWVAARTGTPPSRHATLDGTPGGGLTVICTPSGTHVELAEKALDAGGHLLLEKPLDVSLARGRRLARLADAAAARGQLCSVVSQHRFDPAARAVNWAVAEGRLGTLTSAVASVAWWRSQAYYDSAGWRGTWELDGGGALMNQGVHTLDLLLWLLGRPVEVFARTARLAHAGVEIEDVAVATLRFASGALAVLHATTAAYPGLSVRLQVHGSRGSAIIHDDQLEFLYAEPEGPDEPVGATNGAADAVPGQEVRGAAKPADAFVLGHLRQYEDLVSAIDRGSRPGVSVGDALLALAAVRAVYVSATLGRPLPFDEVLSGGYDDVTVAVPPRS